MNKLDISWLIMCINDLTWCMAEKREIGNADTLFDLDICEYNLGHSLLYI